MELKNFIKNTIISISEAIKESQSELKDKGVIVNPETVEIGKNNEKLLRADGWRYVQNLDFDIIVEIDESQEKSGDGGLKVASFINLGGTISSENQQRNSNRLKFSIPVAFNTTKTPENYRSRKSSAK